MIKKIVPIALVLFFAFGILYASIDRAVVYPRPSLAAAALKFSVSPSPELTPTIVPKNEYYLAYPGILPDHFLYKFKMARDRVWFWLTTNSLKKAELLLLFADKRVGAGKALIEGNKVPLGISTLMKGEKYLERAVLQAERAKQKGIEISGVAEKLGNAALKHEEILLDLKERVTPEGQAAIEELLKMVSSLHGKIQGF